MPQGWGQNIFSLSSEHRYLLHTIMLTALICSLGWWWGKGKVALLRLEHRRGAHLPFQGREPVGGNATIVCDTWPVRCRTYNYLLSLCSLSKATPESVAAGSRTCDLLIASPASCHCATKPHTYADEAVVLLAVCLISVPSVGSRFVTIDPLCFLAGCRTRRLNQALSVLSLSLGFFIVLCC